MLVRVFGVLVVLVPVTVLLTRAMMVTLRALVELALQHLARHTGRMLEHQLAAIHAGRGEDTGPAQPEGQGQRPLPLPHPRLAEEPPERQHGEDPGGDEREPLVGLHELVHRLPVGDVVLGLKSRDHRRRRAQRPQHESPERGDPQPFPPSGRGEQIEEHGADQQRRGQIVERRVEPGPVVAEHRVS